MKIKLRWLNKYFEDDLEKSSRACMRKYSNVTNENLYDFSKQTNKKL